MSKQPTTMQHHCAERNSLRRQISSGHVMLSVRSLCQFATTTQLSVSEEQLLENKMHLVNRIENDLDGHPSELTRCRFNNRIPKFISIASGKSGLREIEEFDQNMTNEVDTFLQIGRAGRPCNIKETNQELLLKWKAISHEVTA
eukprot:IDg14861t1